MIGFVLLRVGFRVGRGFILGWFRYVELVQGWFRVSLGVVLRFM